MAASQVLLSEPSWLELGVPTNELYMAADYASFKCEDCGKIIAAPEDGPAPVCCEYAMRRIG